MSSLFNARNIYLLGSCVDNSLSDVLHMSLYKYLDLPFVYVKKSILDKGSLDAFTNKIISEDFFAANVTFPYKSYMYEKFKDDANSDRFSKITHGINLFCGPKLCQYNFDGRGLCEYLKYKSLITTDSKVCICGSGATARSIALALCDYGLNDVVILTRSSSNLYCLKSIFGSYNFPIKVKNYNDAKHKIKESDLIIDATPVFLLSKANKKNLPFSDRLLNKNQTLIDVSYKNNAEAKKDYYKIFNNVFDGRGMLISQAILCIQQICKNYNIESNKINDYSAMFKVGAKAMGFTEETL